MARSSLMDGIPEPSRAKKKEAPGSGRRNLAMGLVAGVIFLAAGGIYSYQSRGGPASRPAAADSADAKLRAELGAKNPPPAAPSEPVEEGGGHKLQR